MDKDIQDRFEALEDKVRFLMEKRIIQADIVPGAIKQRAMGESNLWVRGGLEADKPTTGEGTANGYAMYFATDTLKLYCWTGISWKSTTLS